MIRRKLRTLSKNILRHKRKVVKATVTKQEIEKQVMNWLKSLPDEIFGTVSYVIENNEKYRRYGRDDNPIDKVAKSLGYKVYDNALVINVKGRPDLDTDVVQFLVDTYGDTEALDVIQTDIEAFADVLSSEFTDFVVKGRSGGYWGIGNANNHLNLTEKGWNFLKNEIMTSIKENYPDIYDENPDDLYEIINSEYYDELSDTVEYMINHEEGCISFDRDILNQMKNLSNVIDEQERAMNTIEYWKEVKVV